MNSKSSTLESVQAALQNAGVTWKASETSISRLLEDQRKRRLGATPPPGKMSLGEREQLAAANRKRAGVGTVGAPAAFDWRNVNGQNYITPVRDQANCGSCVAFGSTATTEGMFQIQRNNPNSGVDLSEADLFYCKAASEGCNCETGWWPDNAFNDLRDQGIVDEACFPYTAGDQACNPCSDAANRLTKISGWHAVTSVDDMKNWLSTRGPLSTCFTVYEDFFYYSGGIYRHVSGNIAGGHCVCVVGYDDTGGFWICKNSWGSGWGDNGYFCIAYGECGIDAEMWAADGIVETGWISNVHVVGLWSIDQDRNAWAYFDGGIGWRQISYDNDNIFYDMLAQLIAAKAAGSTVSFYEDSGIIKQLYVF